MSEAAVQPLRIGKLISAGIVKPEEQLARIDDLRALAGKLRTVPGQPRKLLTHIAQLAYHGRGEGRQADTAYLPELHESCGLDVEAMYATLEILEQAGLIELEKEYPFEDVRILASNTAGWNALAAISRFCERENIPLRDVIVDLRFDLLA